MAHKTEIEIEIEVDGTTVTKTVEVTEFDHTAQEIDDAVDQVQETIGNSILYVAQELSVSEKAQARANIGAVSLLEFNSALGDVAAALADMDEVIG